MCSRLTPRYLRQLAIPFLLVLMEPSWAQICAPAGLSLSTQSSVDSFQQDHGLYVTAGGVFDSGEPTPGAEPYGELVIEFNTCNSGTIIYDIPSIFHQGEVRIQRLTLDNVPLC